MLRLVALILATSTAVNAVFTCTPQTTIRYSRTQQVIPPRSQDNHYGPNTLCTYLFDIPTGFFVHIDFEGDLRNERGITDTLRIYTDYGIMEKWVNTLDGSYIEFLPSQNYVELDGDRLSNGTFRMTITYKNQVAPKPAKIVEMADNGYAEVDVSTLNTNNVIIFKSTANTNVALNYNGNQRDYEDVAVNVWVYDGDSINAKLLGNLNQATIVPMISSNQALTIYYPTEEGIDEGMLFANDAKNIAQFSSYSVKYDPTTATQDDYLYMKSDLDMSAGITYYQPNNIPMQLTLITWREGKAAVNVFEGVPSDKSVPFARITVDTVSKLLPMTIDKPVVTVVLTGAGEVEVQMFPDFA